MSVRQRDAVLTLQDAQGRVRLRLKVTAAGAASIEFLEQDGKVVRTEAPGGLPGP